MASAEQVQQLKEKMRAERGKLLDALGALDDGEAERSTSGEGEWSAKQQMAHLCEMETAYRAWVEKALSENAPNVDNVFGGPPAITLTKAHEHTVAEHVAEMRRQRALTETVIDGIAAEQFERTATQQMFGTLTVMQWLRSYYRHDRMHSDQLSGRDPAYKPRFTKGEPDQRR